MKYESIPSYELKRIAGNKKVNAFKDGFLILTEMLKLFIFRFFKSQKYNNIYNIICINIIDVCTFVLYGDMLVRINPGILKMNQTCRKAI